MRPVSVSIASLARRFNVSRVYVLKLLRDAERAGLIARAGLGGEAITILPPLRKGVSDFFATGFAAMLESATHALHSIR